MVSILLDPKQKLKDITNGADHYFNPKLYKKENKDKKPPKWTRELTKSAWIGNHTFYNSKWSKPHERGFLDSFSYKEKPPSLTPLVEKTPPVLEIQIEEVPPPSIPKSEKEVVNLEAVRTEQFRKFFPEIYSKKFREDYGSLVRQETLSILAKEALTENPDNPKNARKYFLNKLIENPIEDFINTSMTGEPIDYSREEKKEESGFVESNTNLTTDERKLQKKEHEFYKKNPPSTLRLTPTKEVSKYGMPVYLDQHGMRHSESSTTFNIEINGKKKWVTVPTIWPGKDQPTGSKELTGKYWTPDQLFPFVSENIAKDEKSFINPMTGEEVPLFDTMPEAEKYAVQRDMSLQEKKKKKEGGFVSA